MTVRTISLELVYLVAVLAGAAGAVLAVDWVLTHVWSPAGTHTRLLFALVAPLGVVLFALLVEQVGRVGEWLAPRAA